MSLTQREVRPTLQRSIRNSARSLARLITTPLSPGDYLDLFLPLRAGAPLRGRVISVRPETADATTVTILTGRGWRGHLPGQYLRIGVDVDGVRLWRSYSITSPPTWHDRLVSITVRAIPDGVVSNHILRALTPGTMLMLDQAVGFFTQPDPLPAKVLFLTAGSGLTPVMGMLRSYRFPNAVLVHSAPTPERMMFREELHRMVADGRLTLVERFTEAEGKLPVGDLDTVVPDWRQREAWACGPAPLLNDAEQHWADQGLTDNLHVERFHVELVVEGEGGEAHFTRSDVRAHGDAAEPLLDAGEDAGVLMPSGCRMGICFGCVAPLTEGAVRDLRTGDIVTATPGEAVMIQTCVSAAAGSCSIDL
ncbi:ferredoxin reductase [Enemella sp. A6]|uniref:ferredoxin reductase n=1 Tax=Enemella sp. A6 TaxID=3440152 RepID=UPI003EB9988E